MLLHPSQRSRAAMAWGLCLALVCSLVSFCVPERAHAAPISLNAADPSYYTSTASEHFFDFFTENSYFLEQKQVTYIDALPFHGSDSFSAGMAAVTSTADVTSNASAETLSVSYSASGSAENHSIGQNIFEDSAGSILGLNFTLTEPARYSWSNSSFAIDGDAGAIAVLTRPGDNSEVFRRENVSMDTDTSQGSFSGLLPVGTYRLSQSGGSSNWSFNVKTQFQVATGFHWINSAGGRSRASISSRMLPEFSKSNWRASASTTSTG